MDNYESFGTEHSWKTLGINVKGGCDYWYLKCVYCDETFQKAVGDIDDSMEEEMEISTHFGYLAKNCRKIKELKN